MATTRRIRTSSAGLIAFFVLALAGVAGVIVVATASPDTTRSTAVRHDPVVSTDVRTLVVEPEGTDAISAPGSALVASLLVGSMPGHPMSARVLSDSNCAPDAAGVSHCENVLMLANGDTLTVRHNHRMMDVPCMSPGERMMVTPASS